ncbi:MAG: TonB-dependent receptor, partial [Betaproteobacteria bacterium]|nr:TonB-dependent receptor [Betaproteobacteria bacterium]
MTHPTFGRSALALACLWIGGAVAATGEDAQSPSNVVLVSAHKAVQPARLPATVESVSAQQFDESINAVTSAGVLQYLPSVHVRERYIGDRNAVLVMRVNSSVASAQTTVYGDGMLLSNFLNNSYATAPRWGMVSPEEIDRVDVVYGPFSALYPGNSAGGVVRLITREPTRFEAHVKLDAFSQRYQQYGTHERFGGGHASAAIGNTAGDWTYWLALDHLDNRSQPQTFGNTTAKTGAPAAAGSFTVVNSADVYRDIDTAGKPRIIVSSTGIDHTVQDMGKLKLGYRFSPALQASYTLGLWRNASDGSVDSYLRDATGATVYNAGSTLANPYKFVRIDGADYTVSAAAPSRASSEHWMHGITIKASTGAFDWEAVASVYDQKKDLTRTATPSKGLDSGLGSVRPGGQLSLADGTGWTNLDLRGQWRANPGAAHTLSFGLHHDRYRLVAVTYGTAAAPIADWQTSETGAPSTNSYGKTQTDAVYLQDEWKFAPAWTLVAGVRQEAWKAFGGSNFFVATTAPNPQNLVYADRSQSNFSPKLHLAWQASPALALRASVGKGVRYPTVAEMFQTFNGPNNIKTNDPNLKPEQVLSSEWVLQQQFDNAMLRGSFFTENKRDALISQTDVTVAPNLSSIQNVDQVRTRGIEIAGQAAPVGLRGLELNGSLTYTHSLITR